MTTTDARCVRQGAISRGIAAMLIVLLGASACRTAMPSGPTEHGVMVAPVRVIPAPTTLAVTGSAPFVLTAGTGIVVDDDAGARQVAEMLAALLRKSTGLPLTIATGSAVPAGSIHLALVSGHASLGDEGYELAVSSDSVRLSANGAAGLFHGVQTLRQLLPAAAESEYHVDGTMFAMPSVTIVDRPRFAWRGAMLDVARHFLTVREVEQFIDLLALYKMNVLHLHLSDDQGWRIAITSRPQLTAVGSATQVGGGAGGFFSQDEYSAIVRYAQSRYVTVVPEIDMPSHSNAALVAYPELSCSTRPAVPYSGTDVGWSTLCVDKEGTYALIDDVVRELALLTPGPWFHIGGDEVKGLTTVQYARFIERVQDIVAQHGKRMIGWDEIASARLVPTTVAQHWASDSAVKALRYGAKLILSPARKVYLDMKYSPSTELGLHWAGYVGVRDAYDWNPAEYLPGVAEGDVLGIEAALWGETLRNITAVEYLAMPRLPAIAEVAWSPQAEREWGSFRERLASHASRWRLLGVNYFPSEEVSW